MIADVRRHSVHAPLVRGGRSGGGRRRRFIGSVRHARGAGHGQVIVTVSNEERLARAGLATYQTTAGDFGHRAAFQLAAGRLAIEPPMSSLARERRLGLCVDLIKKDIRTGHINIEIVPRHSHSPRSRHH